MSFDSTRPNHFKPISESQPGPLLGGHPALTRSKIRPATREDARALYRQLTGKEPPRTVAEWRARIIAQGRDLPAYADLLTDDPTDST